MDNYKKFSKIIDHAQANKGFVTLVLRDGFRQSGRIQSIDISISEDGTEVLGMVTFHERAPKSFYSIAEIINVDS